MSGQSQTRWLEVPDGMYRVGGIGGTPILMAGELTFEAEHSDTIVVLVND